MTFKPLTAIAFLIALVALSAPGLRAEEAGTRATLKLQRQQQIDAMSLSMEQSLSHAQAANLDNRQRLQLQQLELQQRMQQQQLEQQQLRQSYPARELLRSQPPSIRSAQSQLEQQRFSQERRSQLQQFEWERQQQLQKFHWERQQQSLIKPLAPPLFTLH